MNNCTVFDATLRDSSYAVNFQFSKQDTMEICNELEKSGINYIEVGHGLGLGASSPKLGYAKEKDIDYLIAARNSLKKAKFGAFFIPGIGSKIDIKTAKKEGASFIRIGQDINKIDECRDFCDLAKNLKLTVFVNAMKTYLFTPVQLSEIIKKIDNWNNTDIFYIVDSSGSMLPSEIEEYIRVIKDNTNMKIGFHGHNNLGMANANSYIALKNGASFIDGTIGGVGRSAGNAQTEILCDLAFRFDKGKTYDIPRLFKLFEKNILPMIKENQGIKPVDVMLGISKIHSSHLTKIKNIADNHKISFYNFLYELKSFSNQEVTDEVVKNLASSLKSKYFED